MCRSIDQLNPWPQLLGLVRRRGRHFDHFCGGDAKCCRYNHWNPTPTDASGTEEEGTTHEPPCDTKHTEDTIPLPSPPG